MAKKGASSSNPSATWNAHNISIFCDVCIKEVEAGKRPDTHFNKEEYANIRANFKAETGHDYERGQFKNKWDALKNEWKLWKELVGKETGLGWNSSKGTVDVSEELHLHLKYYHQRRKESIRQIDSNDEDKIETMQDLRQATRNEKKKGKNGGAAILCRQIDHLVEAYETRSSANSLMRSLHIGSSIPEVIATIAQLPGCEPPSKLWLFATCLYCSAEKRDVFATIQDPEVQLTWLKYIRMLSPPWVLLATSLLFGS
ncbi:unnamed protein product [Malus baccata var. baccata]